MHLVLIEILQNKRNVIRYNFGQILIKINLTLQLYNNVMLHLISATCHRLPAYIIYDYCFLLYRFHIVNLHIAKCQDVALTRTRIAKETKHVKIINLEIRTYLVKRVAYK